MGRDDIIEDEFSSDEEFDDEGDSDDSDSSQDIDAKVAQEEVFDAEFLKCYSALKRKDSKIYDKQVRFFDDEQDASGSDGEADENEGRQQISRPKMTLLDHQLKVEKDGVEEPSHAKIDLNKTVSKSFYEKELEVIKRNIESVAKDLDDSDDDLLVIKKGDQIDSAKRTKLNSILDKMEDEDAEELEHLKEMWADPKNLSDEDRFLRDYILNKRYIAKNVDGDDEGGFFSKNIDQLSDVDDDDDQTSTKKKNARAEFHSEEANADKIVRIPRGSTKTIRDLVEKNAKKEKRLKQLTKEKKKKKLLKDADCEDIIDDLPTKFHYRETEPNDFGLTAEELLMATDEELEKWVKLKEAVKYRTPDDELKLKKKYDAQRNDVELKRKIFTSVYGQPEDAKEVAEDSDDQIAESNSSKKRKKRKRGLNHKKFAKTGVAPDRLLAYGLSKKKLKKSKLL